MRRGFLVCVGIHLEVDPKRLSLACLFPTKINILRMNAEDSEEKNEAKKVAEGQTRANSHSVTTLSSMAVEA